MKALAALGERERAVIEERRRTGYRVERLGRFGGELEPQLRGLIMRLLPGVGSAIDLAAFVDTHAANPIGRGNRAPGVPAGEELFRRGLEALVQRGFSELPASEQDELIRRMRRGEADAELGIPAKAFVDRVLTHALAGYLAHPDSWERIGFHGPAYPEGFAWISPSGARRRHEGFAGSRRL